jgi:hypothetical protein
MAMELEDILGAAGLECFRECGAVAGGLPGAAYTRQEIFALENARLTSRSWTFVAFADALQ